MSAVDGGKPMGQVIQNDEARILDHLGEMVRGTVEETLNALLEAEADQLCGAGRYERSQARQDTRAGSYERSLQTSAGEVNLKVPKLRRQTFETVPRPSGARGCPSTVSDLNKKIYAKIEAWRNRRIEGEHPEMRPPHVFGGGSLS